MKFMWGKRRLFHYYRYLFIKKTKKITYFCECYVRQTINKKFEVIGTSSAETIHFCFYEHFDEYVPCLVVFSVLFGCFYIISTLHMDSSSGFYLPVTVLTRSYIHIYVKRICMLFS
ncbi:hypothetical protein YC2023_009619 [Brassica napus]